jgi:hypothetical protein
MPRSPKTGGAVIEPRSFTTNRKKFGATSSRLAAGPIDSPQQGAAELQHALVNKIREHLLDVGIDLKSFCAARSLPAGLNYEHFYRNRNGTTMMGLTDVMFWSAEIPGFAEALHHTIATMTVAEVRSVA